MSEIEWTNPSVRNLAGSRDPVLVITEKTRALILDAMDNGWKGPPFDPLLLAQSQGLAVVPREDILDARLIPKTDKTVIEYNPNRPNSRIRFSLAHEIAHTLFPDHNRSIHHRSGESKRHDDWQLELLCNISAAEILMPIGPSLLVDEHPITIDRVLSIRKLYDASVEAVLLRLIKLTKQPITVFAAAKETDDGGSAYRIDYAVDSSTSQIGLKSGMRIPSDTILAECTSVGFTAKGRERWSPELPELDIECVGVSAYRGNSYPRVLGIVRTKTKPLANIPEIRYLVGNATEPRGKGNKIIAHIVNDKSPNWGRGFGLAVSKEWPQVREVFRKMVKENRSHMKLGNSTLIQVSNDLSIFNMVAQHGFGPSDEQRIRYRALSKCLTNLANTALEQSASVHMPRIGTGYAGGSWDVISELIDETLVRQGIDVTVYDLPGREKLDAKKSILDFITEDFALK